MAISSITIFGLLGNIMSGLVYLSPASVFVRIAKRRSTEEFESIPYVSKLLNAYFWVYYGFIKPNSVLVATVNIFGAAVEIVFLTIFLLFAPPRMKDCDTSCSFGCGVSGSNNLTHSLSARRRNKDRCCGNLVCNFQHDCICFPSFSDENCCGVKECGVHAFPSLFHPFS